MITIGRVTHSERSSTRIQVISPETAAHQIGETLPRLFPFAVGAAAVPLSGRTFPLHCSEAPAIENAVAKRRAEFAAGRHCTRAAMAGLGYAPCAIPSGPDRAPVWPSGLVGSITHGAGVCAAVVGSSRDYRSIGIDTELVDSIAPELAAEVLRQDEACELDHGARPDGADWLTLHFCLKEAAYKAFYPIFRRVIGFQDMRLRVQPLTREFLAEPQGRPVGEARIFRGRYRVECRRILAACW